MGDDDDDDLGDLFGKPKKPSSLDVLAGLVRRYDHDTSWEAVSAIVDKLSEIRRWVLMAMYVYGRPMSDPAIDAWCTKEHGRRAESTYRHRRTDLTAVGLVIKTDGREMVAGTNHILWELTDTGRAVAKQLIEEEAKK